jgi:hypothetical protein
VGRRGGRAAAAEERRCARGQDVPAEELGKGRCCEFQEGDVVLVEQEIGKGRLGIELSTARPNSGGGRTPTCSRADASGGRASNWPVR